MRLSVSLVVSLILFVAAAEAGSWRDNWVDAENVYRNKCTQKWVTDYSMQQHCINEEMNAVSQLRMSYVSATPSETMDFCDQKWAGNFSMILHCVKEQRGAIKNLNKETGLHGLPDDVANDIKRECANKWGTDYNMRLYCVQKQSDAYKALQ